MTVFLIILVKYICIDLPQYSPLKRRTSHTDVGWVSLAYQCFMWHSNMCNLQPTFRINYL